MPEDAGSENETVPMAEYKKLQRKYDRRDKAASGSDKRVEAMESSIIRLENLVEGYVNLDTAGRPEISDLLQGNAQRRKDDMTSADLGARLNHLVEDADEYWEDSKFDAPRALLDVLNSTGDMSKAQEIERLVEKIVDTQDSRSVQEQVDEAVALALQSATKASGRVDTGESSATTGPITRGELGTIDPRDGISAMCEKLARAHDQISK